MRQAVLVRGLIGALCLGGAPAVVAVAYILGTLLLPLLRRAPGPAPAPDLDPQPTEPAIRLVWSGSAESAAERLRAHGFEVEVGPDVGRSHDGIPIVRSTRPPRRPSASR